MAFAGECELGELAYLVISTKALKLVWRASSVNKRILYRFSIILMVYDL